MQKMLMITIPSLVISCVSFRPTIVKTISFERNACFTYCYDFNKMTKIEDKNCGDDFVAMPREITYCDGVIGPDIEDFATYLRGKVKENIAACRAPQD
jgi:hypothetical protein